MSRYRQLADVTFTCRGDEKLGRQHLQFSTATNRGSAKVWLVCTTVTSGIAGIMLKGNKTKAGAW